MTFFRQAWLATVLFIPALGACKTTQEAAPVAPTTPVPKATDVTVVDALALHRSTPPSSIGDECEPDATACSDQDSTPSPTMCSASAYDDQPLGTEGILQGWGATPCAARAELIRVACRSGKRPPLLGGVNCVPDPSAQECPPSQAICTTEYQPKSCTAHTYAGEPLSWRQRPKSWGPNECWARMQLTVLACRLSLKPSAMGEVTCEDDQTSGECPGKPSNCESSPDKIAHVCRATRYGDEKLSEPFVTFGQSRCEAEHAMRRLACQYADGTNRLKPSLLTEITCEPDSE